MGDRSFRIRLWATLEQDNAEDMIECLQAWSNAANGGDVHLFLSNITNFMWNPNNATPRGLLEVCCTNRRGVAQVGSENCAVAVVKLMNESAHRPELEGRWIEWKFHTERRYGGLIRDIQESRQWVPGLMHTVAAQA